MKEKGAIMKVLKFFVCMMCIILFGTNMTAFASFTDIGDEQPVQRALVARMLALVFGDEIVIEQGQTEWYDGYVNSLYALGFLDEGVEFRPLDNLTLSEAQEFVLRVNPKSKLKIAITEENKDTQVSMALWVELFVNLVKETEQFYGSSYGMTEKLLIMLATSGTNPSLNQWAAVTDTGGVTHGGINLDAYVDKQIRVLSKGTQVLAVLKVENSEPTVKNAFVVDRTENDITIFSGGATRRYAVENGRSIVNGEGQICDITISDKLVLNATFYNDSVGGVIKRTATGIIELDSGSLLIGESFKVYDASGPVKWKMPVNIVVGTNVTKIYVKDGKAAAAVMVQKPELDKLRIVIGTTGFTGYVHKTVALTSDEDFTVYGGNFSKDFKAGEVFTTDANGLYGTERLYIRPQQGARIELLNIKRNWPNGENPKYLGSFELGYEAGGYSLINEIDIEDYLYSVVPSEMPSSYGVSASAVQAITARSYAYNQFFSNKYHAYGANIDDSVSSQVYNNIPANPTSIQAVDETRGQYIAYEGEVISANFFSTSSGMTANSGEVWANGNEFPIETPVYLSSKKQFEGDFGNLSFEDNASVFFKNTDILAFDSKFAWFRWNTQMTKAQLEKSINDMIGTRYKVNPSLIKTLQKDGRYRSRPIESVGALLDIEAYKRSESGSLLQIKIIGTKAIVLVTGELNIRYLLKPGALNRIDGTKVDNYSLLPSAFCVFEKSYDKNGALSAMTVFGGGNGHGAGMSQVGVKGMLDRGYAIPDILFHYYEGTSIITK